MRQSILLAFVLGQLSMFSAWAHADVVLSSFTDPSNGRNGVALLDADSLRDLGDFPASIALDTCWLEVQGRSLFTSSLTGRLERFDLLTGRSLASVDRTGVQWSGMTFLGGDLLVAFTDRSTGLSNIEAFDPMTLQDRGSFLPQSVRSVTCWLTSDPAGTAVFGSSPDGTLFHFGRSGELLGAASMPDLEWSGLAFAAGRLFAAFTDRSGGSGGIRVFSAGTFDHPDLFLAFPPGHTSGPFELLAANDGLYASFLDGAIERYDSNGHRLASVERLGFEWRGLAIAPAAVPGPSTLLTAGLGGIVLVGLVRRRRKTA